MTGFASISREEGGDKVSVSLKSVNHRFLDVALKSPQSLASVEQRVKAVLQQKLTRGRIEASIFVERTSLPAREIILDESLLQSLSSVLDGARAKGLVTGVLTVSDMLRVPQVMEIRAKGEAGAQVSESLASLVESAIREATDALVTMRETEGRYLAADLSAKLGAIGGFVDDLERLAAAGQEQLAARLRERLASLPADLAGDPAAMSQEVVRFVARSDVDEEIVRMRGHIEHWQTLAASDEPCGRKLDFLLQEMNREINTIGSKAEGPRATETVIAAKAELERLREQVQNVE
ncbi:MAG TPA: YicC/YloC family endoribonuclease [Vicinamibacterales bacterium]|nr:YicC/YloC family endoribonuclease [Vicinamibacterales bacterium]